MPVKTRTKTKRRHPINSDLMVKVQPLTENQEKIFKSWDEGKHLFIYGAAGTGKTFCALYKALHDCLKSTPSMTTLSTLSGPLWRPERLVSYLVTTKTSLLFIRFHTRTWLSTCSRCLMIMSLRCFMDHSKLKRPSSSGPPHSFVV